MTADIFKSFWGMWSNQWLKEQCYRAHDRHIKRAISDLCGLKEDCASEIFKNYEAAKATTKELYFQKSNCADEKRISRYKRAAVMTFAVMKSNPLDYKEKDLFLVDPYFLKERLAVFIGIGSIIQDFPQEKVSQLLNESNDTLYCFESLGIDRVQSDDTFLESLYKDIFLSELYGNYNILTMANVYGLLTEKCSLLSKLIKPGNAAEC